MNRFRIFTDFAATPEVIGLLQTGTKEHELIFSKTPVSNVFVRTNPESQFAKADIAFGQPDPEAVAEAKRLKWLHISSSGIARYDNPQFRALVAERKIAVSNSASVISEACAFHLLSFMVAQARQLPQALKSHAADGSLDWYQLCGSCGMLRGETVLILGYGAIGKRLAELLRPFDVKLIAYRRKARGDEGVPVITERQLPATLGYVNHIVNVLPDSAETQQFFDEARFEMIRPGAIFYNIGRGTTVVQDALLGALRSGKIGAAWLDVTDPEPLPDEHPLRKDPNCFITPHIAGGHTGEAETLARHFLKNFDRFVRGEPLVDRVM
jgi:phosphoglycerate dehydrogenase-like enzyme